jgi:tetratricopeptide (TPR) repeat protein
VSMSGPDRGRVFQIFDAALGQELPERQAWLVRECAGDAALQAAVETLLEDERTPGGATGEMLGSIADDPTLLTGKLFGHFRIVDCIGRGGMGAVFRAERTDGINQKVALKSLRGGLLGTQAVRFAREMKTLARLDHPAVARLIDAGAAEDGTPWIAMELVDGEPIDAFCQSHQVSFRERVRLIAELAGAVAFAHRMFVVHRDIKPGNVLMTREGKPKLIDFGIAKLLDDGSTEAPLTRDGGPLFTPGYAAPEQVTGSLVSAATDVFALGALGYRLLTGEALFPGATSPLGYMMAVTQQEPKPASRAALEHGSAADARLLRGDLDTILAKALARDSAQRYQTAAELGEDLQRYLQYRPVRARPRSLAYRAGKFLRRNPLATTLTALLIAGAFAAASLYAWQARRVAVERDAARAASARAERINKFLTSMLQAPDSSAGGKRDITVAQVMEKATLEAKQLGATEPLVAADLLLTVSAADSSLARPEESLQAAEAALALRRSQPGHDRLVAMALLARSDALWALGKQAEAEPPAREALALLLNERNTDKELFANRGTVRDSLGIILTNTNREKEAEASYRAALEDFQRAGINDGSLGALLNNLAVMLGNEGRSAESWEMHGRSLKALQGVYPEDAPQVLTTKIGVAGALEALNRRDEAIPLYREVIAARERVLGPEHLDTVWAKISLASNFTDMGRYAEAAELAGPAAAILVRTLGENHPVTAFGWNVFGMSSCAMGRYDDGIAALTRTEKTRARLYGEKSWLIANTRARIGICLSGTGRKAEAETMLLAASKVLEESRGKDFERTQDSYKALRDLYAGWNRPADAARYAALLKQP